uniref:Uncharacterized protein n=1 Tax=Lepeophtheirus salmonis TaxID=72036 RepID=A0A0K2T7R6_LEPSM
MGFPSTASRVKEFKPRKDPGGMFLSRLKPRSKT